MSLQVFTIVNFVWIGVGLVTLTILLSTKIRAPYGRHTSDKWGAMISNRWGWFIMEFPALILFPLLTILGPREKGWLSWLLVGLWTLHYFNRTVIFPFRLRTKGKKMPLTIVFSALFFNGVNGFLNGYFLGYLAPTDSSVISWNVFLGLGLFATGMTINQVTDTKLIALRKEKSGYQIPRKWLFEFISCPNHFGEMVEWIGFAIVAMNLPAITFAVWTFANLLPRAMNHHRWYHEQFPDYPARRKAVFPFIL